MSKKIFRNNEPMFFHLRIREKDGTIQPCGGATIIINPTGLNNGTWQTAEYSIALCSPKDNFSRRCGKRIAGSRLVNQRSNLNRACQTGSIRFRNFDEMCRRINKLANKAFSKVCVRHYREIKSLS